MCCSSKKKQIQSTSVKKQTTQPLPDKELQIPSFPQIPKQKTSFFKSNIPKSRWNFGANQFEPQVFNNQQKFIQTTKVNNRDEDYGDRQQNYSIQNAHMNQSQLLMPKQLLTYDLDHKGGITEIPVLNTFHYETQLDHLFINQPALAESLIGSQNQYRAIKEIGKNSQIHISNPTDNMGGLNNSQLIKRTYSITET